ncbi:uncharacterized protein LOC101889165 [Musca domestica]|uniref:Uncharacterized protein LOC101889165 n=1 Tax=Musca domestica TaxID=7370 RepID=A0A1I8NGW5_MUSDO|nr:uncharacterized protein LOC101889165 [Musca domestica]
MKEIKSNIFYRHLIVIVAVVVTLMCNYVCSTPMMYKRNPDDKFERDLVPVSSTVIPLTAVEVSYGLGGQPSEEYKEAYLKKLRKKVHEHDKSASEKLADPDTLITIKKKHIDGTSSNKAKVKGIITKNPIQTGAAAGDNK